MWHLLTTGLNLPDRLCAYHGRAGGRTKPFEAQRIVSEYQMSNTEQIHQTLVLIKCDFFFKSRFFPLGVRKYLLYFPFCRHPQLRYLMFEKITCCFEFREYFEEWELFEYNITVLYVVFLMRHVGTQTKNDRLCSNVMHFCVKGMWYEMSWIVLSSTWHTQEEGTAIKDLSLSDSLMGMHWRHFPDCQQVQEYPVFWV